MAAKDESARIIDREARAALVPLGVVQKGRSRTWLDDHVWWVTVVEFQPSKWGQASFLNLGVCWLTYPKDYLSFDVGYRLRGLVEFRDASQFTQAMSEYARLAAEGVSELRGSISTPASALHRVLEQLREPGVHDWERYHAAVFAGLKGDIPTARRFLQEVLADPRAYRWQEERAQRARQLLPLDTTGFREVIAGAVIEARALLKLPQAPGPVFVEPTPLR
jgi:hypothetical protein